MAHGRKTIPIHLQYAVIERDKCTCQYCGKVGEFIYRYGKPAVVENPKSIKFDDYHRGRNFYNGTDVIKFEIDHIKPVCNGGENIINNLILSCRRCNRAKGYR